VSRDHAASFAKAVDILDQVHGLSPTFAPGTVLLFLVDGHEQSPCGPGYALDALAYHLLDGTLATKVSLHATSAEAPTSTAGRAAFLPHGVLVHSRIWGERLCSYHELVLYRLSRRGEVTLLREIPDCQSIAATKNYAPLERI